MKKYEGYNFFGTLKSPCGIKVPEYMDVNLWTDFFKNLRWNDIYAPLNVSIAMLCFDMFECLPDTPFRQFYFELGIEAMDAEKEYIFDGAMGAGLIERGVIDIVNFAVSGTMPDNAEGLRKAICCMFEEQTSMLKFLSEEQFRAALRFAYKRRT